VQYERSEVFVAEFDGERGSRVLRNVGGYEFVTVGYI
jgi:hypothetical protein